MQDRISTALRRAGRLAPRDWLYLATAAKELVRARVRHAVLPTGEIVRQLRSDARSGAAGGRPERLDVARASWAINAVAPRLPWRSDCLIRAMAADRWLRRHGLLPQFYIGVAREIADCFEAHAWLRCGDLDVTGGNGEGYVPLLDASASRQDPSSIGAVSHRSRPSPIKTVETPRPLDLDYSTSNGTLGLSRTTRLCRGDPGS